MLERRIHVAGCVLGLLVAGYILFPSSPSKRLDRYTTGLVNTGNDCFANSTFQALASLNSLRDWLSEHTEDGEWASALHDALIDLARESSHARVETIWPYLHLMERKLHGRLSRSQQDAHELLVYMLDLLEKECGEDLPFAGKITDSITCLRCGRTSSNVHRTLLLERQPSESIFAPQTDVVDGFRCECGLTQIEKTSRVSELPQILVVHINRSTSFAGQSFRNNSESEIPLTLGAFLLKAVVFHYGVHSRGHYTCARRKAHGKSWWLISDDRVSEATSSQIKSMTKDVYLLFYEMATPISTLASTLSNGY